MQDNNFNIVHLAIGMLCVVTIATIVVVISQTSARDRGRDPGSTQLRGIHQGMVTYANSNKDHFVGLNPDGTTHDLSVEHRFQYLIENDFFTPEYVISPMEERSSPIQAWDMKIPFTANHYSYAMLQIPESGGRRDEWSQTLNPLAIVVSDRNTGTTANPSSIHTDPGETWAGRVLWNDNHVGFENSDTVETKYGGGELNAEDRLFESPGTDDALLIHAGN